MAAIDLQALLPQVRARKLPRVHRLGSVRADSQRRYMAGPAPLAQGEDTWLVALTQPLRERDEEVRALHLAAAQVNRALVEGRFDRVNQWLQMVALLEALPTLVAVGIFRFASPARRLHPERLPSWEVALEVLRQRLMRRGIDADHKLRGL